jgi:predicted DsbA family dithiol-disulfide isomerase
VGIVEVFADVACPFTHAGLRRFVTFRSERGVDQPTLRLRAWSLELVNGEPHSGPAHSKEVSALRDSVAPDLFTGFDPERFPESSLGALAAEQAAYRRGASVGESFSLAVRTALFEEGQDVSDASVLGRLRAVHEVPEPDEDDEEQVHRDYGEGQRRGVSGSPHFFTPDGSGFFCPSMHVEHEGEQLKVSFDADGYAAFVEKAFA